MANETLARMSDVQLQNLFASGTVPLSQRAKDVVTELERRGYIYDLRHGDFITCEEWNNRHGRYAPMDCEKQERLRSDNERADRRNR